MAKIILIDVSCEIPVVLRHLGARIKLDPVGECDDFLADKMTKTYPTKYAKYSDNAEATINGEVVKHKDLVENKNSYYKSNVNYGKPEVDSATDKLLPAERDVLIAVANVIIANRGKVAQFNPLGILVSSPPSNAGEEPKEDAEVVLASV